MFKGHQNSELVYSFIENEDTHGIPAISQSASVSPDGSVTITAANCSLDEDIETECTVLGIKPVSAEAVILTGEVHAHNDFDAPEAVKPQRYDVMLTEGGFRLVLPKCSVVTVTLR